jgi:putative oxygen-independent coproporphyrinogen III oxidase
MSATGKTFLRPVGIYIHWPYCSRLCRYCAFTKFRNPANAHDHERHMVQAMVRNLTAIYHSFFARCDADAVPFLTSIYFGGGTPSLLSPASIETLIDTSCRLFHTSRDCVSEITLEANPADLAKWSTLALDLRAAGVNRLSLGVQTLHDEMLRTLGRDHTRSDALLAVDRASHAMGGDRVSVDFMYGLPHQTLDHWNHEFEDMFAHAPSLRHISLYHLTIERGTSFWHDARVRSAVPDLQSDAGAEFLTAAVQQCAQHGLRQYEVSNFASPSAEAVHNQLYWNLQCSAAELSDIVKKPVSELVSRTNFDSNAVANDMLSMEYIGLGPGAHGRLNAFSPSRLSTGQLEEEESLPYRLASVEMTDPKLWLESQSGSPSQLATAYSDAIQNLVNGTQQKVRHVGSMGTLSLLDAETMLGEYVTTSLRCRRGLSLEFCRRLLRISSSGADKWIALVKAEVEARIPNHLIAWSSSDKVHCTTEGMLLADRIASAVFDIMSSSERFS